MFVWNLKCTKYPPGFTDIPDEEAAALIKKGEVQDPRIGALHMDTPSFTTEDYQQKVVKPAVKKAAPKKKIAKKKAPAKKKAR